MTAFTKLHLENESMLQVSWNICRSGTF